MAADKHPTKVIWTGIVNKKYLLNCNNIEDSMKLEQRRISLEANEVWIKDAIETEDGDIEFTRMHLNGEEVSS